MKTASLTTLLFAILFISSSSVGVAQTEGTAIWKVTGFDINANIQQAERTLNATATINAVNVGQGQGSTFTVRLSSKGSIKTASVSGAAMTFRCFQKHVEICRELWSHCRRLSRRISL